MRWPIKFHRPITFADAPPSNWELIVVNINNRRTEVRYAGEVSPDSVSLYVEGPRAEYLTVGKQAEWDRP